MGWNDLIGRQIGPYEIIDELGRGGSARVFRAYQEPLQRYVAIKVLLNDAEDRLGFVSRFARELEAVAKLQHPNIVEVYEAGELEDLVYLVMQCVNGGTFRQRLGRPLPIHESCSTVIQVAQALQHAHARGIVHRDVKPSNMLIDSDNDGRVLLTDFGIAKLAGMRGLTKSGMTIGTPESMAPEQAEGREIDARADVYSLGCVLYEALAGRAPFVGAAPVSVLYQQVHVKPDYIRVHNPEVPRELARIVEIALAKQPEQRFISADSLAWALHPFTAAPTRGSSGLPVAGVALHDEVAGGLDLRTGPRADAPPSPVPTDQLPLGSGLLAEQPVRARLTQGLGVEGLDALFPDDPEAKAARSENRSGPLYDVPSGYLPGASLLTGAPLTGSRLSEPMGSESVGPRPTVPLASWQPGPGQQDGQALDLPLTPQGELDMHALMSQVPPAPPEDPGAAGLDDWSPPADLPPYEQWSSSEEVTPYTAWDASVHVPEYDTWMDESEFPWLAQDEPDLASVPSVWGDAYQPEAVVTPDAVTPPPIWRPDEIEILGGRERRPIRPNRPGRAWRTLAGIAAAAAVALALVSWALASALGAGVARGVPGPSTTVSRHQTATPLPAATVTLAATATPTQQQVLDQQAAAAMRGVNVTAAQTDPCLSTTNTTSFARTDAIWIGVCMAHTAPTATLNVNLYQGASVVVAIASFTARADHIYHMAYNAANVAQGSYHIVVTFNGGTAADVPITVQ